MNNNKKFLSISASQVSCCIGKNKYTTRDEIIIKLWIKYYPETFDVALKRNKLQLLKISKNNKQFNKYNDSIISKNNGLNNENKIINEYQEKYKVVVKDNNKSLYRYYLKFKNDNIILHNTAVCG